MIYISKSNRILSPVGEGLGVSSIQFLKAVAESSEKAIEVIKLIKRQIELTMFAAGADTLEGWNVGEGRLVKK